MFPRHSCEETTQFHCRSSHLARLSSIRFRPHQPSEGIRKMVFGGQVTDEEFESLNRRKEMTGSGTFAANGVNDESE
ncbi:hypothetical protein V6N13_039680 [Hibiscus sabdariffa]